MHSVSQALLPPLPQGAVPVSPCEDKAHRCPQLIIIGVGKGYNKLHAGTDGAIHRVLFVDES